jgi:hypothetical protein
MANTNDSCLPAEVGDWYKSVGEFVSVDNMGVVSEIMVCKLIGR